MRNATNHNDHVHLEKKWSQISCGLETSIFVKTTTAGDMIGEEQMCDTNYTNARAKKQYYLISTAKSTQTMKTTPITTTVSLMFKQHQRQSTMRHPLFLLPRHQLEYQQPTLIDHKRLVVEIGEVTKMQRAVHFNFMSRLVYRLMLVLSVTL